MTTSLCGKPDRWAVATAAIATLAVAVMPKAVDFRIDIALRSPDIDFQLHIGSDAARPQHYAWK
jgi:hypothetical protein